jgi:hypothetical protein
MWSPECKLCDQDYIRVVTSLVNDVRERMKAQVHVLVTQQYTGGGLELPASVSLIQTSLFSIHFPILTAGEPNIANLQQLIVSSRTIARDVT